MSVYARSISNFVNGINNSVCVGGGDLYTMYLYLHACVIGRIINCTF